MNDTTPAGVRTNWLSCLFASLALVSPVMATEPAMLQRVQTIPLEGGAGRFDHLVLDGDGSRLFIANLSGNSLDVVDLKNGKLAKQIAGQHRIQGVAYVPEVDRIFVGNGMAGVCNVFDAKTYDLVGSVKIDEPDNVRYDPRTKCVYVAHAENALTAIDAKTLAVKATIVLPGSPEGLQLDPLQPRLYVDIPEPCQVAVVDTEKNEVVGRIPLTLAEANFPLALDAKGGRLFVGCRRKPSVVVMDVHAGKEISVAAIPGDVDDLFYDAKRDLLYASCGAGVLVVLQSTDGKTYRVIERAETGKLARTCLFDPQKDRLYVPVPRQEGRDAPELLVFQVRSG